MEENNKIIAEFLGWEKIYPEGYVEYILPKSLADPIYKLDSRFILEFNTDWNWLMEVVEKIESLDFVFQIHHNVVNIFNGETKENGIYNETFQGKTKIKTVYNACVEFINFYNKQKEE